MQSASYGIYPLVFVSEIERVRFLIRQQLVCKYRTPALSMKYSLFTENLQGHMNNLFLIGHNNSNHSQ